MNEKILKLREQIAAFSAKQKTILESADAEGVSAEDRAKHIAEFDRLQGEKDSAAASLKRADQLHNDDLVAAATPATRPIVHANNPHPPTAGNLTVPAVARRHGPLKAFKGNRASERAYEAGLFAAVALYGHEPSRARLAEMNLAPQATLSTANNAGAA